MIALRLFDTDIYLFNCRNGTDGGDYLAYYKKRTLIIRLAFEQYLLKNPKVKEELANGRSRKRED